MLGDLIGQESGQITVQRVLAGEHGLPPAVEVSFAASGTLLGVEVNDLGTYESRVRPDGTLQGEGQGVLMSPTGASATWRGQGVGTFTASGGTSYRGAIVYSSGSPEFADLRGVAGVFEWEVDASGKAEGKLWAWK
ncbi:hypothetical protein F4556_002169 [Kitasatospora gansuensis]|uniref:DUF3224 domain-containing protein n=1 Tax=Kitasatospora gansuensis TaxID=258050 RepID=A0A7W7WHK6_9ACTN|nr:hypothetical protein [Kitasatospora gansuensis]MBB4946634.1 hypothetical protein [Kitasatospora gansuensis]